MTGEGVAEALAGAQVVIDLANSPSFEEKAALEFFETAGRNCWLPKRRPGWDTMWPCRWSAPSGLPRSGYFKGKAAQENLIRKSGFPTPSCIQPSSSSSPAPSRKRALSGRWRMCPPLISSRFFPTMWPMPWRRSALAAPVNGIVEIAGPEKVRMSDLVGRYLKATKDSREVVGDRHARYFGYELDDQTLVPGSNPRLGATRFDDWLKQPPAQR